jgi:hypothetical protein
MVPCAGYKVSQSFQAAVDVAYDQRPVEAAEFTAAVTQLTAFGASGAR